MSNELLEAFDVYPYLSSLPVGVVFVCGPAIVPGTRMLNDIIGCSCVWEVRLHYKMRTYCSRVEPCSHPDHHIGYDQKHFNSSGRVKVLGTSVLNYKEKRDA